MALTSSRMPMVVDRWLSRLKEVRKGVSNCLPDSLIQVVCHASSFKQHAVLLEGMDDPVVSSAASGASSPPPVRGDDALRTSCSGGLEWVEPPPPSASSVRTLVMRRSNYYIIDGATVWEEKRRVVRPMLRQSQRIDTWWPLLK